MNVGLSADEELKLLHCTSKMSGSGPNDYMCKIVKGRGPSRA